MRFVIAVCLGSLLGLPGIACSGGEKVSSNGDKTASPGDGPKVVGKADRAEPAEPGAPAQPVLSCPELKVAVRAQAESIAKCEQDQDCVVIGVGACNLEGVGCDHTFKNKASPHAALEAALAAYSAAGCQTSKCDCPGPPPGSSCIQGRCSNLRPIIPPPADTVTKKLSMKEVEKNKWFEFGGTYWRLWGTAFTGSQPKGVSVSPDGSRVFVTNTGHHNHKNVTRFDPATLKRVTEVSFPGNAIESMVSPDGKVLWVSNFYHQELLELDTETLKVKRRFKVENLPKHFDISADEKKLWVSNWAKGTTSIVDLESGKAEAHVKVGKQPRGTGCTHDGKKVYVTNFGGRSISVIDAMTREVIATIDSGCRAPRHVAISRDDRVFVSCYGGNEVLVIDSATDEIVRRVKVGDGPKTISLSQDERFAFTADYRGSTMSMIDLRSWEVLILPIPTVKTSGLSVAPDDRRLYLTGWSARNLMVFERLMPGEKPTELGPQGFGAVCRQRPKSDCKKFP